MEATYIWSTTFILMSVIVLPYAIRFRKQVRHASQEKQEARKLGIEKPLAQHPVIDINRCIGCASCVKACPEGGVLGIVDGYAQIINGMRCIGHGECEKACPVDGIFMGLGDLQNRDDIPCLDDHFQTNIPGLQIIGELGGLALIRNAILQGQKAVQHLSKHRKQSTTDPDLPDLCIVGAGPAGLTAALTAKSEGLDFILLDQQGPGGTILQYPRKKLVLTQPVELPLWGPLKKDSYPKEELLDIWNQIIKKYDIKVQTGIALKGLTRTDDHFQIETTGGAFKARNVILALGRRGTPRKLGVPGEDLSKVAYKLIDAQSYSNNDILVIGGGDSAIEAAMGLAAQPGNRVTLSYRKETFFRIKKRNETKLQSVLKRGKINVIFNSQVNSIHENEVHLNTKDGPMTLPNEFVFIFAGGIPPFKLLKGMGIKFGGQS